MPLKQPRLVAALMDRAPVGLAVLTRDCRFVYINKRLAEWNGMSADDHIGRAVSEILPSVASNIGSVIARLELTDEPLIDELIEAETPRYPGQTRLWMESWYPIDSGDSEERLYAVMVRDVTRDRHPPGHREPTDFRSSGVVAGRHLEQQKSLREIAAAASSTNARSPVGVTSIHGVDGMTGIGATQDDRKDTVRRLSDVRLLQRSRQLELLSWVAQRLIEDDEPESAVLDAVFGEVANAIGADVFVSYQPYDDESLRLRNHGGLDDDELPLFETVRYGDVLCGRVALHRKTIVIEDIAASDVEGCGAGRVGRNGAYAGFPLTARGNRLLGTVAFIKRSATHFGEGEVQTIATVCAQVAAMLERTRLADELRAREDHFRAVADYTHDWETWIGADGATKWVNPAVERIVGVSADQCLHMEDYPFALVHPEDRDLMRERLAEALSGVAGNDVPFRIQRPDGIPAWGAISWQPIVDSRGKCLGYRSSVHDLTALKQAEEALRVTQSRLETALDASQVVLFHQDSELRYTWIHNPALGRNAPEVVGKRDRDLVERVDDAARLTAIKTAVMESGLPRREEVQIMHEGELRHYDLVVQPAYDFSGDQAGVNCAAIDITTRKRAEVSLANAGESFRQLVEQSPFGVYALDADFRLAIVNAGARKVFRSVRPLLGADFEQALRALWSEPFASECLARFRHTLATGEPYRTTSTFQRRLDVTQSASFDWKIERLVLPDGRPGVVCHFYDLSERERFESALRTSEHRYRTLLNATGAITWFCPKDGRHVEAPQAWMAFTGQSAEAALGDGWTSAVHADDVARVTALWSEAVAGRTNYSLEFRVRRHDGQWRWLAVSAAPVQDLNGCIVEWFGMCFDITDRKAVESELEEAARRKDTFLATLAHELRNPLAPIRTGLEIMKLRANDAQVMESTRAMMARQVAQMSRLLDDLLDVARIAQGKLNLRKTPTSLADALNIALESSARLIDTQRHTLSLSIPSEVVYVNGDATRLSQVVANLLNNAAKYTPPGGQIRLSLERQGSEAVVSVEDTGIGIPVDQLGRVFDLFAQVNRPVDQVDDGLGLGLNIVRQLVELHGGTITVVSRGVDLGSAFIVRLPTVEAPDHEVPATAGGTTSRLTGRRILVVDDNRDAAAILTMILKILGNETRSAHDGQTAVNAAEAFRPDIILMDIGMPHMNGYDACRHIRQLPWAKDTIMVAQTGWGQEEDRRMAKAAGFDLHLTKPIELSALEKYLAER